ncbi:MAG TPA: glycosyl transferase [Clostridiaceae bacterium]|nr:glycosyl transferase [Clostridiaceae bacterium]
MRRVLLLTASTGGGHNSASKAIKDALEKVNCEVLLVDALKFVSPTLDRLVSGGYEKSAKYIPKTYGSIYRISSRKSRKKNLDMIMRQIMGRKILHLIQNKKPDAIIGTHPFPMMALMKYKENGTINIPIVSVLTDYTAHPAYIQKNVDAYIVGSEDLTYLLKNSGVDYNKIYPFGIPISENFLDTSKVDDVKKQLELEDKFTVLLMGGSFGAGNIKDSLLELLSINYDLQIIVVTGRDYSLKEKLSRMIDDINPDKIVRILGYTKYMPELLTISSVLVTKPGGLTTTEAIIKAIPMVIPYYIPGQEAGNVDFLLNNGMALKTSGTYTLSTLIEILIKNPERRSEIVERMLKKRKLDSAAKTADLVVKLIEEKNGNKD